MPNLSDKEPNESDLVLVNPCAGGSRGARKCNRVEEFARRTGWNAKFIRTKDVEDLRVQVGAGAAAGRSRIFVLGGDGTFHHVVNVIGTGSSIVLGIIPAGGGNDLAAALGLPSDALDAAKLLLDAEPCAIDVVRVRTSDRKERLYVGGGGVGLDAQAAKYANDAFRHIPGRLRYVLSAIRALLSHGAKEVTVCEPNHAPIVSSKVVLVSVLNTPSFGAGVRLAPGAKIDDGELALVVVDNLNFWQVVTMMPALLFKGDVRSNSIRRTGIKRVRIETSPPTPFHGDGEILGMTPVEIEVLPQAIRVLRPRNCF